MSFAERVRDNLLRQGERPALRCAGTSLSFGALHERCEHWRRFLDELEVGPGERVLFLLESSPDLVAIHLGTLLAGRISVPFNPRGTTVEIERALAVARPALVVVATAAEPALRAALASRPDPRVHVLEERFIAAAFAAGARSGAAPLPAIRAEDPAMIVFTSGSTGRPKGATLRQGNLLAGIEALEQAWALRAEDHLLLALPLFHVHGLGIGIHGMAAVGHTVTLEPRFEPAATLAALAAGPDAPSLFYGVPTMYHRLVEAAPAPLRLGLRLAVSGSAPLPRELHARVLERLGLEVLERYGMSETLMLTSNPLVGERRPGTVGPPLPCVSLAVVGDDGRELPAGEEGEIAVSGPNVFGGYWDDAEASRAAFDAAGRFRTGDIGFVDPANGYLRISGRKKDLVISGGFNVHPREVEEAILAVAGVLDCAVAGLPDPDLGEIVAAFVVPGPGFDRARLGRELSARLSGYKRPRRIIAVRELPRNAMGKVLRHRLPELIA